MKRKYTQEEVRQLMRGRIYFSREDQNIFVPRETPFSWTMNLGNPWSWVIMLLEFLVVVGILHLVFA